MSDLKNSARLAQITHLIQERMEALELDRHSLATRMGGDRKQTIGIIRHWLLGNGAPGPKYVDKLAEVLMVDPNDLKLFPVEVESQLENDEDPPPPQEEPEYLPMLRKKIVVTIESDFVDDVTIILKGRI